MLRQSILELASAKMAFSAGHFTIFSATEREPLHGHNYRVVLLITTQIDQRDIAFDYAQYKQAVISICEDLDYHFLLPETSPFLRLEKAGQYINAYFSQEKIPFLQKDVKILSVANTSLEGLSYWFLQQLLKKTEILKLISKLEVKVFNGSAQSASAVWNLEDRSG